MENKKIKISVNKKDSVNSSNELPLYIKKFVEYYNSLSSDQQFKVNILFRLSPTAIYMSGVSKKYISDEISVDIKKFVEYYNSLSSDQKFKINIMFNMSPTAISLYLYDNKCNETFEGQKRR